MMDTFLLAALIACVVAPFGALMGYHTAAWQSRREDARLVGDEPDAPPNPPPSARPPAQRTDHADREKFSSFLNGKQPDLRCPVCSGDNWATGGIYEIRSFHGGLPYGARVYPAAPVTCVNCGYTYLFSAVVAGLVEAEKA